MLHSILHHRRQLHSHKLVQVLLVLILPLAIEPGPTLHDQFQVPILPCLLIDILLLCQRYLPVYAKEQEDSIGLSKGLQASPSLLLQLSGELVHLDDMGVGCDQGRVALDDLELVVEVL